MVLRFDEARATRLLVIPPLFDEANKLRRQLAEIMRRLDLRGIDCFCPDLPGCNESLAPHGDQTLVGWRKAISAATAQFGATHVFAVRSGCWLAPTDLPGWLYEPARPAQILRGMVRARTIATREAGRAENATELLSTARNKGITLAGWVLSPELVRDLETIEFSSSPPHRVIEQAEVGGKPLWLRAENDEDPEQADALAAILAIEALGE